MSSISGQPTALQPIEVPNFSEASGVMAKIEAQVGRIADLFQSVNALMKEISALGAELSQLRQQRPQDPGSHASDAQKQSFAEALQRFNQQMMSLHQQIANLNTRLETTQRKLHEAEQMLTKMQNQDLPAAEQRDAAKAQERIEQAQKALETSTKGVADEESDAQLDNRLSLRVVERNIEIFKADPTLKKAVGVLALLLDSSIGRREEINRLTTAGAPKGGGLPPIEMP